MEAIAKGAEGFISLFEAGGEQFMGMVTGILPMLIVLITFVNAIIKLIGEEKVEKFAARSTNNVFSRYIVLPVISVFFLTNPMAYTFVRFVDEKYKPATFDAAISFVHPITGLFPHANPAELFVWLGVSDGIRSLGLPVGELAVRYFLTGVVVIFIRGLVTERITLRMMEKQGMLEESSN